MRTISLELLRHGPAHNQLLSPLTQYLALCENHSAVTVQVPFEHNQLLHRLRALSYRLGEEPRQFQVRDTAAVLGALLAEVPGLTADVNRRQRGVTTDPITHVRLVLSASELALLPFELALAPNGFPGAGQSLLLQSQMPLCITRETRRVPDDFVEWPSHPRLLLVSASPPGYARVPTEAHLLALRKVLDPWIGTTQDEDAVACRHRVSQHLSVLTHASAESIEVACASGRYTHVHILAHGHEYVDGYDVRFGLALHDRANPEMVDVVSGERLATALRVTARGANGELCRPAVVTLASCHSGNLGTVAGAGASVAHALHEAGVPMVIASQFPLSYTASVRLAEVLYEGLLWGEDPRNVLVDLRRQLHTQFPTTHDWASLVAYASLPANFERQLAAVQIHRAKASIDVALRVADEATRRFSRARRQISTPAPAHDTSTGETALNAARPQLIAAKNRLSALVQRHPTDRARIGALLASTEKREAENRYSVSRLTHLPQPERVTAGNDALDALKRARDYYWDAFVADRQGHWVLVQFLSLTLVLERSIRTPRPSVPEQDSSALWTLAQIQSLADTRGADQHQRGWACANLLELCLLAPLIVGHPQANDLNELKRRVVALAQELTTTVGRKSFILFSTRRQIARYLDWYGELAGLVPPWPIADLAEVAFEHLPECEEPDWSY